MNVKVLGPLVLHLTLKHKVSIYKLDANSTKPHHVNKRGLNVIIQRKWLFFALRGQSDGSRWQPWSISIANCYSDFGKMKFMNSCGDRFLTIWRGTFLLCLLIEKMFDALSGLVYSHFILSMNDIWLLRTRVTLTSFWCLDLTEFGTQSEVIHMFLILIQEKLPSCLKRDDLCTCLSKVYPA